MKAFEKACAVEADGMDDLMRFIEQQSDSGRFVLTHKGRLSETLQRRFGDALMNRRGDVLAIEFKVEAENKHGKFFLETWSNRQRFKTGWMFHLEADFLFYYFIATKELFVVPFPKLQRWAFQGHNDEQGRLWSFRERKQSKYKQRNDTWGRCVPIDVIQEEVGYQKFQLCE